MYKEILQRQHNGRGIYNSFCGLTISGGVYPICYTVHDAVTGSMILEETLERARNNVNEKKTIDSFEQEGSQMGNPRLYLGAYELHLNLGR